MHFLPALEAQVQGQGLGRLAPAGGSEGGSIVCLRSPTVSRTLHCQAGQTSQGQVCNATQAGTRPRQTVCSSPGPTASASSPEDERRPAIKVTGSSVAVTVRRAALRRSLGLGAALGLQTPTLPVPPPSSSCAGLCPDLLGTAVTLDQGPPQRPRFTLTTCLKAQTPHVVTW